MMAGSLRVAMGTTVVDYSAAMEKPKGPPVEQILAEAMSHATQGATEQAKKKLVEGSNGLDIELHTQSLTVHVTPRAVVMTCVILFEVKPLILETPGL